jgi:3-hydroxyisobutyrate dehydrogenase
VHRIGDDGRVDDGEETAMPSVGVVGLGRMGLPIARHLAAAGYRVTGFDIAAPRVDLARAAGIRAAGSVRGAARGTDILVVVLPGATEFREALIGAEGALAVMTAGSTWVDLTSNDPRVASEVAALSAGRGIHAVGAPMGGGVAAARSAQLQFHVGGTAPARAIAAPLLETLARPGGIRDLGDDISVGYAAKLLVNTLWFGQVAAVSEALLLGERLGIPPTRFPDLLTGSAADSAFVRDYLGRLIAGDYVTSFGLRECVEELEIVQRLAHENRTPFSLTDEVVRLHRAALEAYGAVDGEMLVARLLAERAAASEGRAGDGVSP